VTGVSSVAEPTGQKGQVVALPPEAVAPEASASVSFAGGVHLHINAQNEQASMTSWLPRGDEGWLCTLLVDMCVTEEEVSPRAPMDTYSETVSTASNSRVRGDRQRDSHSTKSTSDHSLCKSATCPPASFGTTNSLGRFALTARSNLLRCRNAVFSFGIEAFANLRRRCPHAADESSSTSVDASAPTG
jgi:hypothetical protein